RVPPEHQLRNAGNGVLMDGARKLVPDALIARPKGYFPVPALKHLQGPYLDIVRDLLTGRRARERGLFKPEYVAGLIDEPTENFTPLRGSKLWQVALLEFWLQEHGI